MLLFGMVNEKILVVDDDRANQQVALAMLETMGCKVEIVGNGRNRCYSVITGKRARRGRDGPSRRAARR